MFPILWYYTPGHWTVKTLLWLVALVGVFFLLMEVVFPVVSPLMPYNTMTVGGS